MGKESMKRKDFLRNIAGIKNNTIVTSADENTGNQDPLFEKYARKNLGNRVYGNHIEVPVTDNSELNRVGNVTSGLAPYTGPWSVWEMAHLLRRVGFGVKKAELDSLQAMTVSNAVDALLTITAPTIPSSTALNYYQNTLPDSGGMLLGESWTSNNLTYVNGNDNSTNIYRIISLSAWSWGVCINDNTSIREKMTHFWYQLIPINFDDLRNQHDNAATACNDYMSLLRSNALGNFKTLIKAIAKVPAMLVYLGNQFSSATTPNENFARELMELFTLGKVPTQNYTEDDVKAASKIFSGWRVSNFRSTYPLVSAFNASYHNQSNKTFSAFFGNTTINNQAGTNGANEFDIYFDLLFTQQQEAIAKYLCRRLYRFFVYYDIDANIEANVIVPLSAILISNNWNIAPVLSTLLKSEHFYDVANRGVMIKSPIDFITGTLRTLKINTTPALGVTDYLNQYTIWNYFQNYANTNLEQAIGLVPNVSGWKAYYQSPTYYQNWINSNTIQQRAKLLTSFVNGFTTGATNIKIDPILYVQQFPNSTIQDPDLLIDTIVQHLLCVDLSVTFKSETKIQTLLAGQITNGYWTTAWNNYTGAPTNASYLNIVKTRINSLLTTILQLAEYQLM